METDRGVGAMQEVELPHKGAMRWVREAAVSADGAVVLARARIEAGHPCVRGGVLLPSALIELMAQGAAAGVALANGNGVRRVKQGVLAAIREFEVLAPVRVGREGRGRGTLLEIWARRGKAFGALSEVQFEVWVVGGGETSEPPAEPGADNGDEGWGGGGRVLAARGRMTFHLQFE